MFPLSGQLFIPSLFVTPVVLLGCFLLRRRSGAYPTIWRWTMVACVILCGLFLTVALAMPLYSEREKGPEVPGGFSVSLYAVIGELIFWSCVVIPAFPILVGLTCLPPPGWGVRKRSLIIGGCLLFVGALAWVIVVRNAVFAADYQQTKRQERLQRIQYRQQQQRVQQQLPVQFQWRKPPAN